MLIYKLKKASKKTTLARFETYFESNKKPSVGLLQRWSILLQMTTFSPAPEGSGLEVGVIVGLQL